jgi:hypothetical protein
VARWRISGQDDGQEDGVKTVKQMREVIATYKREMATYKEHLDDFYYITEQKYSWGWATRGCQMRTEGFSNKKSARQDMEACKAKNLSEWARIHNRFEMADAEHLLNVLDDIYERLVGMYPREEEM